jgi:type IV fimbrial biogenesis protein FimT
MVELLAVVMIAGALAAAASPMFVQMIRDRRVARAAGEVSGMYSLARARALGRGNAVMVRWTASAQRIEVREAVLADALRPALVPRCAGVDWESAAQSRPVADFRAGAAPYELAALDFLDEAGGAQAASEVCFTPRGRTFIRQSGAGAFAPMTGVARVRVTNTNTGLVRAVMIPPSGAARISL